MKFILVLVLSILSSFSMAAVDLKASSFEWHGSKVTGKHYGSISLKSADLKVDKDKITGGEFVMDMNSFTITDLEGEWAEKFIGHMKSDDFFSVSKYPTAKLVITKVEGNKVTGNLTVKEKTNPVTFTYKKEKDAFVGELEFDRTKFDMTYGSGNFFKNLGDKMIHDQVKLNFKVVSK